MALPGFAVDWKPVYFPPIGMFLISIKVNQSPLDSVPMF